MKFILPLIFTLFSQFAFGKVEIIDENWISRDTEMLAIADATSNEILPDSTFNFTRLIFNTSACFGSCPVINLEISSDKSIRYSGNYFKDENFNKIDSARFGNFTGQLSDQLYNELIDLIITSKITEMDNNQNQILCCDAAIKTLILYHNDTRKYYKAMFEPSALRGLISFLYSINQNLDLTQVEDNYYFEK